MLTKQESIKSAGISFLSLLVQHGVNMDTLSKGSKAQLKSFLTFDFRLAVLDAIAILPQL